MSIVKKYLYWINSAKYTAVQKFSVLGMAIVSFMILARMLGPEGFGVWGLFLMIAGIAETARTALIKNGFIRFMHQTDERHHGGLQRAAYIINISISCFLALLFLVMSSFIAKWLNAPSLSLILKWYSLTIILSSIFLHAEMLLNAKMDFRGICWIYSVRQGSLLLMIVIFFLGHLQLNMLLLSLFYLGSILISTVVAIYICYPYLRKDLSKDISEKENWVSQLWYFGKYVFGNNISSLFFRSTDTFMTSIYFGPAVSAYYNACVRISNLVDMPSQVLGDVLFPRAAKFNSEDRNAVKNMYEKTVSASLIFSVPALCVILLLPETILYILAGEQFIIAVNVLRIMVFFGFLLPFLKQFGTIMDATGRPDINFRVMFLAFCINVGTNLAGIYFFGTIGAVIGTATTYLIIFIISQAILYKRFGITLQGVFGNTVSLYGELFAHGRSFFQHPK